MRIAIDARSMYVFRERGIGTYVRNLLTALSEIDKENEYVLLTCNSIDTLLQNQLPYVKKDLLNLGENFRWEPIAEFDHRYLFSTQIWEQFLVPERLRQKKIDLYYSPFSTVPVLSKCITVPTIHDLFFLILPYDTQQGKYYHFWTKISVKLADSTIAVSQNTKNDIVKYLKASMNKITVIYEAPDEIYKPIKDKELLNKFRRKYNLPEEFILFVGVVEPRKNIVRLLEAYKILKEKYKINHKLVIVGPFGRIKDLPYNEPFDKVINLNLSEDVIFIGYVKKEELPSFYNISTVFVFPSLYEGFGLPILEAMSCGIPVITSNVSSIPEVTGDSALLVNPHDIEELAAAINNVISDNSLRKILVEKGLIQAKKFSWKKTAYETLSLFKKIVAK